MSVYNQDEFEAGVLDQLDREAKRRNAEQQRKFLYKEYSNIKAQIRSVPCLTLGTIMRGANYEEDKVNYIKLQNCVILMLFCFFQNHTA